MLMVGILNFYMPIHFAVESNGGTIESASGQNDASSIHGRFVQNLGKAIGLMAYFHRLKSAFRKFKYSILLFIIPCGPKLNLR